MSDGAAGFLYPFLDRSGAPAGDEQALLDAVAGSTRAKARETIALRAQIDLAALERCADELRQRLEAGATVLAFGNGGSATDAQDLVVDLSERGWPAIALNADVATLTAIANDVGYEHVFARQLEALAAAGDVALAISTSGASANVVRALEAARRLGLTTVALAGYGGGDLADRALADHLLSVDAEYVPRIQEAQATIYHLLIEQLGRRA